MSILLILASSLPLLSAPPSAQYPPLAMQECKPLELSHLFHLEHARLCVYVFFLMCFPLPHTHARVRTHTHTHRVKEKEPADMFSVLCALTVGVSAFPSPLPLASVLSCSPLSFFHVQLSHFIQHCRTVSLLVLPPSYPICGLH